MNEVVSLELNGRDSNQNALKKTIGNVNPNATDLTLKTFAQNYNNLTTNSLLSIVRIERKDITSVTE